jgi:ribosomal protein S18 acetylase RimI-like enzyme
MDLITGYPEADDAFVGWFMVDGEMQGRGIGSDIFADVRASMKAAGFDYMALAVVKENREALRFWKDQGFTVRKESVSDEGYDVYLMDREI